MFFEKPLSPFPVSLEDTCRDITGKILLHFLPDQVSLLGDIFQSGLLNARSKPFRIFCRDSERLPTAVITARRAGDPLSCTPFCFKKCCVGNPGKIHFLQLKSTNQRLY